MLKFRPITLASLVLGLVSVALCVIGSDVALATVAGVRPPDLRAKSETELVQVLRSPVESERSAAIWEVLARFADDKVDPVTSPLAKMLVNGVRAGFDPRFRAACGLALASPCYLGSVPAIDALARALQLDTDRSVRVAAAAVLDHFRGNPIAASALRQATETDPDATVRAIAGDYAVAVTAPPNPASAGPPPLAGNRGLDLELTDLRGWAAVWVRQAAEALGCTVEWNSESSTCVVSASDGSRVRLVEGMADAELDGNTVLLPTTPVIVEGRMYVPVGLLAQALSFDFSVDGENKTVYVWPTPTPESPALPTEKQPEPSG